MSQKYLKIDTLGSGNDYTVSFALSYYKLKKLISFNEQPTSFKYLIQ